MFKTVCNSQHPCSDIFFVGQAVGWMVRLISSYTVKTQCNTHKGTGVRWTIRVKCYRLKDSTQQAWRLAVLMISPFCSLQSVSLLLHSELHCVQFPVPNVIVLLSGGTVARWRIHRGEGFDQTLSAGQENSNSRIWIIIFHNKLREGSGSTRTGAEVNSLFSSMIAALASGFKEKWVAEVCYSLWWTSC